MIKNFMKAAGSAALMAYASPAAKAGVGDNGFEFERRVVTEQDVKACLNRNTMAHTLMTFFSATKQPHNPDDPITTKYGLQIGGKDRNGYVQLSVSMRTPEAARKAKRDFIALCRENPDVILSDLGPNKAYMGYGKRPTPLIENQKKQRVAPEISP